MQKTYFKRTILSTLFLALFFIIFGIITFIKFFPIQSTTYSLAHIGVPSGKRGFPTLRKLKN